MKHIRKRVAALAVTALGQQTLYSEGINTCPWCKKEPVILSRRWPQGQWIPLQLETNERFEHDLHRCDEAVTYNETLRYYLGLKPNGNRGDELLNTQRGIHAGKEKG